jgi:tRNA pseudouridine55 synthase
MHGLLLVDKPTGMTSHDVVRIVRRMVKPAKVGHTGTLDPAASGLVVIMVGAATRALDYLGETRKEYRLSVRLGEETDTDDVEGEVIKVSDISHLDLREIEEALESFRGVIDQTPPRYSAVKKNGVPMYKLARKGVFPEIQSRKVEIFLLNVIAWAPPLLSLDLVCSRGTYARSLARDLGQVLGVGGRLESLVRTSGGSFRLEDATGVQELMAGGNELIRERLIPLAQAFEHIPDILVQPNDLRKLIRGASARVSTAAIKAVRPGDSSTPRLMKIVSKDGSLVILVRPEASGAEAALLPIRVFKAWDDNGTGA